MDPFARFAPHGRHLQAFDPVPVAAVDPRLVHYGVPESYEPATGAEGELIDPTVADLTEPEGVQYERFVPHLINLVSRQRADIEALEARLAALES